MMTRRRPLPESQLCTWEKLFAYSISDSDIPQGVEALPELEA